MDDTPLDEAFRAHDNDPGSDEMRLRFFARVLDAELLLLLATESVGERVVPEVFDLEDGRFALVFDSVERMGAFLDRPAPYCALPGWRLAEMLAGQGVGIGLNLGVAPSATLLPPDAVAWLAEMAAGLPEEIRAGAPGTGQPSAGPQ